MVETTKTRITKLPQPVLTRLTKKGVARIENGKIRLSQEPRERLTVLREVYPILRGKVEELNKKEGTKLGPVGPAFLNLEKDITKDIREEIGLIIEDRDENRRSPGYSRTGAFNLRTVELRIDFDDKILKL